MHFYKDDHLIYFNHIPRTGGRYVGELLQVNGYKNIHSGNELVYGRELIHLDTERQEIYYNNVHPSNVDFAIVRHPLERFYSSFYFVNFLQNSCGESLTYLEDYDYFYHFFEEKEIKYWIGDEPYNTWLICWGAKNLYHNWYLPQTKFIKSNTQLWKFENGLDNNFYNWLRSININIYSTDVPAYKRMHYDVKKPVLSHKIQENVLRYYEDDLKLWESL